VMELLIVKIIQMKKIVKNVKMKRIFYVIQNVIFRLDQFDKYISINQFI